MHLKDGLRQFEEWACVNMSHKTRKIYVWQVERFIKFSGNIEIASLNITSVAKYISHLQDKGYSSATIAHAAIAIRQYLSLLYGQKLIDWDYKLVKVPKYQNKSHKPIARHEHEDAMKKTTERTFKDQRDKLIMMMLYDTGVRVSELVDLTLEDLNLNEHNAVITSKKNHVQRIVMWTKETADVLDRYLEQRSNIAKCQNLFISLDNRSKGKKLTPRSIQRMLKQYNPSLSPHRYRHGWGKRACDNEMHIRHIQTFLGHKHISSTQVYTQVYDADLKRVYKKKMLTQG